MSAIAANNIHGKMITIIAAGELRQESEMMEIKIKPELRPCIINGKKKGLFHCWEQYTKPIAIVEAAGMNPAGQISYIAGIVEIEDGHVIRIHQSEIQFVDNKLAEYDFTETALKGAEQ